MFVAVQAQNEGEESGAPKAGENQFDYVKDWDQSRNVKGWWHSFELPNGQFIDGVCALPELRDRIGQFPIPADLTGKRVLDIGAWDGWFTFEMERRGAHVVAVDCWDNPRFRQMHSWLNSRAEYRILDIYEITPEKVGKFDIVLFMGVLYHLKHPLLALERVCSVTAGMAAVDSFVLPSEMDTLPQFRGRAIMEFYETTQMGGQTDNWVGPNIECLMAMSRAAGFARVEFLTRLPYSACLACYRTWEAPNVAGKDGPKLLSAFHHTDFGINFSSRRDDYVACEFSWPRGEVSIGDVRPSVGPYGAGPINLTLLKEGQWQVGFKLPPGLSPGWHDVSVRVADGGHSNSLRVAVDLVATCSGLEIVGAADGTTWAPDQLDLGMGDVVTVWVRGLPENVDRNNVDVLLNDVRAEVLYISPQEQDQPRQVNIQWPDRVQSVKVGLQVRSGSVVSSSLEVAVTGQRD